jgi:hypothetical protein
MSKGTRTNRSRRSIFRSMGGSDVILFGDRCARPSYCSQRRPRFPTKTGLKSSISGPFCESTPSASSNFPCRRCRAPVNAPRSRLNNSEAMSAAGTAAQFTATNGVLRSRRPRPGPGRQHRREHAGRLRPLVRRETRRAGQGTRGRRGDQGADTLLLPIPNQSGVDYNAPVLDSIIKYVAPELGWR